MSPLATTNDGGQVATAWMEKRHGKRLGKAKSVEVIRQNGIWTVKANVTPATGALGQTPSGAVENGPASTDASGYPDTEISKSGRAPLSSKHLNLLGPNCSWVSPGEGGMNGKGLPGLKEIEDAAEQIAGVASRTPLVESPALSKKAGHEVYLKLECFQPVRVFKIRGAYNKISRLRETSVVAASSGNHGIAVAYSSRLLGKKCTVVVPETAVREKVDTILEYGADVVRFGRFSEEREAKAREIAKSVGSAFVPPFDDPDIIAGQGTCGLEIAQQLSEFDAVLVPVGGGGLISGISTALKSLRPKTMVFGVEPQNAPKLSAALKAKKVVSVPSPSSIADGLIPSAMGELAYEACSRYVDGVFTVSEEEILKATKAMVRDARVVAEPSGAAALAPLLSGSRVPGRRVVVVVSGGNISRGLLMRILAT